MSNLIRVFGISFWIGALRIRICVLKEGFAFSKTNLCFADWSAQNSDSRFERGICALKRRFAF